MARGFCEGSRERGVNPGAGEDSSPGAGSPNLLQGLGGDAPLGLAPPYSPREGGRSLWRRSHEWFAAAGANPGERCSCGFQMGSTEEPS